MREQEPTTVVSDTELVADIRAGNRRAIAELFARHNADAVKVGRLIGPEGDAEELAAEAFARVLAQIVDGKGPTESFRAYLHAVIRNLNIERTRQTRREQPASDKLWLLDTAATDTTTNIGHDDAANAEIDDEVDDDRAARALRSLPENWQQLLWRLEVQGRKPAEVAAELAVPVATVSDTAYRAREGLRLAYLNQHLPPADKPRCVWTRDRLSRLARGGLSPRATTKVRQHLSGCVECAALYDQLYQLNTRLGAVVWPIVLAGGISLHGMAGTGITQTPEPTSEPDSGSTDTSTTSTTSTSTAGAGTSGGSLASALPLTATIAVAATTLITGVAAASLWLLQDAPQPPHAESPAIQVHPQPAEDLPPPTVDAEPDIENIAADIPPPGPTPAIEPTPAGPSPASEEPDQGSSPRPGPDPDEEPDEPNEPEKPGEPEETEDPETEPTPDPDPADLTVGTPTTADLGWRHYWLLTVPVLADQDAVGTSFTINLELTTSEPTGFIRRLSSGWDCGPIENGGSNGDPYFFGEEVAVTCQYTYQPGQPVAPLRLILESINTPTGAVTIASNADPDASNSYRGF